MTFKAGDKITWRERGKNHKGKVTGLSGPLLFVEDDYSRLTFTRRKDGKYRLRGHTGELKYDTDSGSAESTS